METTSSLTADSKSLPPDGLSPVAVVVQVVSAGRRAFEPQRVINDYHADTVIRFAQPSNAFIKTYGKIFRIHPHSPRCFA